VDCQVDKLISLKNEIYSADENKFCFYLSGILFYLFVYGPDGVDFKAINISLTPFPQALWPTIFDHIQ
jgi:hypothetical protein